MLLPLFALAAASDAPPAPPPAPEAPPDSDIFLADLDLAALHVANPRNLTARVGYDNQPAFVPDGTGFLYVADVDGTTDVFRYTFASRVTTRVTTTPEAEFSPTPLSAGFSAVRVAAPNADVEPYTESQQVWRYDIDGKPVENLLPDVHRVGYHAWIDPRHLALVRVGPNGEPPNPLVAADLRTGKLTPIAPDAGRSLARSPRCCGPAGRGLLFVDKATWTITLATATGKTTPLVATPPNAPGEPEDARSEDFCVLPDGSLLMAHGTKLLRWHPGGDWEVLAVLPDIGGAIKRLAVSPDGTMLLFVVQR